MTEAGGMDELWKRLRDVAYSFLEAGMTHKSLEADKMAAILYALERFPELRRETWLAAQKAIGQPRPTLKLEAAQFLEAIKESIRVHNSDAAAVARCIVGFLPGFPRLFERCTGAPTPSATEVPWDAYEAAATAVAADILPMMIDPDDINPEAIVREALRALDADPAWVKDLFQA